MSEPRLQETRIKMCRDQERMVGMVDVQEENKERGEHQEATSEELKAVKKGKISQQK
jgi:hypothetical protein